MGFVCGVVVCFLLSLVCGGIGRRSWGPLRLNLKKMLCSVIMCLNCFLGPVEILSSVLEFALLKTISLRSLISNFCIEGQQKC